MSFENSLFFQRRWAQEDQRFPQPQRENRHRRQPDDDRNFSRGLLRLTVPLQIPFCATRSMRSFASSALLKIQDGYPKTGRHYRIKRILAKFGQQGNRI